VPWLSDNPMWEAFASRALFHATYGGADFGECRQTIERIGDGGADDWHRAWTATADALVDQADASAKAGHAVSAREAYIRATTYYRTGYFPLFGSPVDKRVRSGFERETEAFAKAAPLFETPVELVEIPFEDGRTLPGVFVRPSGDAGPRPTIVHTNGYDSNVQEMFVAHVGAALRRGYSILLFDGPGQGRCLIRDELHMRPDWETVVRPVIDYALDRPEIDSDRIVLAGWSFGGFLAPRAAAFEDRIAALWADPGQWDLREALIPRLPLSDEEKERFPNDVDPEKLAPMDEYLRGPDADPMQRWRLVQRGLWVHGVDTVFDYFAEATRFEISPVAGNISCPTLVTQAEGDPLAANAPKLLEAVGAERKDLIRFTAAEGAAGHCEGEARRLFHQRCYDWLDETLER
jgi:alpha-beta hydrolase superfamily lysophospholipase